MADARDDRVAETPLTAALHDEIDEQEALGEEARAIIDEVKAEIFRLVEETEDEVDALTELGMLVEQRLDALTSKAARMGYDSALRRGALRG